jgi:hypothetical protein
MTPERRAAIEKRRQESLSAYASERRRWDVAGAVENTSEKKHAYLHFSA